MSRMNGNPEEIRLRALWDSAIQSAALRNAETVASSIEIQKEKTQYFEKITLGSGATIAALISFLGAHASRLQPSWLLRASLIVLALAMVCAMLRNWLNPYYIFSGRLASEFTADREKERRKRAYVTVFPGRSLEDGGIFDVESWVKQHESEDALYAKRIKELRAVENRGFTWIIRTERATLFLISLAMVLLIALAWKNF